MIFAQPIPFREAIKHMAAKQIMPTSLGSGELAQLSDTIRRQSFYSARTAIEGLLDRYKTGVESILNPQQVQREGEPQTVTEGFNPATLRTFVKDYLREISYQPKEGEEGTIKDLSSDARINLVAKTNTELAQGAGNFVAGNDADVIDAYPAQELFRQEARSQPRNWDGTTPGGDKALTGFGSRWMYAAQSVGDANAARILEQTGRMIALKSSGIWAALGSMEDGLGNPYPPFAFNSGMWVQDITRSEAQELGLIRPGQSARPAQFDMASLFQPPE
jgi:hypothetical protein